MFFNKAQFLKILAKSVSLVMVVFILFAAVG
jgi:hypothetical protein